MNDTIVTNHCVSTNNYINADVIIIANSCVVANDGASVNEIKVTNCYTTAAFYLVQHTNSPTDAKI